VHELVDTVEMDELYTFVDRRTRCILDWRVVTARTGTVVQEMVPQSVLAQSQFTLGLDVYQTGFYWPAIHYPLDDKSETFSVQGINAELRR
jgi:hypothetical protein